jgi:diaminopimelate decarboxylase
MKTPFVSLEKLREITQTYPTPFHIYDENGIRENARKLNRAFSWNEGYREYFAVKATPNPYILQILKEEGCGADCSSYTELLMAKVVGFTGDDIMFSSNVTPAEDFILANNMNAIINFDDITHIDFASRLFSFPEKMCIRYNPGGYFTISNAIMDNPGEAKYGFTRVQMFEGVKKLMSLGVKEIGLHAFLSSNTFSAYYYPTLANVLCQMAVALAEKTGVKIAFINLSGGIGIPYRPDDKPVDIFRVGDNTRKVFKEILTPAGLNNIPLYTELGRFMLAPYGALVSTAIHEKHIHKEYIGLDACAANLMRPAMYGAYHHITVMGKEHEPHDQIYDVTGGLCENNDKFAVDRNLPKIDIGDLIYIHDTGAHGYSMGYNYNGKLRSAEILLTESGEAKLIRRAETPDDYFATFDFTSFFKDKKYGRK